MEPEASIADRIETERIPTLQSSQTESESNYMLESVRERLEFKQRRKNITRKLELISDINSLDKLISEERQDLKNPRILKQSKTLYTPNKRFLFKNKPHLSGKLFRRAATKDSKDILRQESAFQTSKTVKNLDNYNFRRMIKKHRKKWNCN